MKAADRQIDKTKSLEKEKCGIIMPISTLDGCTEQHWIDVKNILIESIEIADFDANLVSNADDVGIIQKTIIQNLYDNPIVVCDVSGKNPNVMFELGMRLAFDKPTIIVKDDKTTYSFDTSPIEHLTYPRDLRFNKIIDFKKDLSEKIQATYNKAKADLSFSTFLKHFGKFTMAKLETTEVSKEEFILQELKELRCMMLKVIQRESRSRNSYYETDHAICEDSFSKIIIEATKNALVKGIPIDSKKMRQYIFNQVVNSSNNPACFEISKEVCSTKIEQLIDSFIRGKPIGN